MDLEYRKQSTGTQWAIVIIIIIVFLLIVWITAQFIQNNENNKSVFDRFKRNKNVEKAETVNTNEVLSFLKNNSTPAVANKKQEIKDSKETKEKSSHTNENLPQLKANILAAHDVMKAYLNAVVSRSQSLLVNFSSKELQHFEEAVNCVNQYLTDIATKLGELNKVDPTNHKLVHKYVKYLGNKVRSTYNKLDQVQYALLPAYQKVYYNALKNNLTQEQYLSSVQPILDTLTYEYKTHQSLNSEPNRNIETAYNEVVDEINTKRTKIPIGRIQSTEQFYVKLNKNFSNWWKANIADLA